MATMTLTQNDIYKSVRSFLVNLFETQDVIRSIQNGSPLPLNAIVMNIINETDLDVPVSRYQYERGEATVQTSVEMLMQIDFYGDQAHDRARTLANLWRNHYATDRLENCQPLYAKNPIHAPFVNEKSMYEDRYIVELSLQYNPYVTHDQTFIDATDITLINV